MGPLDQMKTTEKDKKLADICKAIRKYIPDDIKSKIPIVALTKSSELIFTTIRNLLAESSESTHRQLETEGKMTQRKPGHKMFS